MKLYLAIIGICFLVLILIVVVVRIIKRRRAVKDTQKLQKIHEFLSLNTNSQIHSDKLDDIKIYYINLDRSPERNEHMKKQLQKYSLKAQRISGVDGSKLELDRGTVIYDDKVISYVNNYNCSKGELGCLLSHLKAIYTAYKNNEQVVLIIEDDISFSLLPYWPITLKKVMGDAPVGWNIISLFNFNCTELREDYVLYTNDNPCYSTLAYIINRNGMYNCLVSILANSTISFNKYDIGVPKDLASDVTIYHMAKNSYFYNKHFLVYAYNGDSVLDSTIHTDHTPLHITQSLKGLGRYIIDTGDALVFKKSRSSVTPIPKILHQVWISFKGTDIPEEYKKWTDECKSLHSGWEYKLWKDDENRNFIAKYYPWFLQTYDNYDKPIKRVDSVRYFLLFHYGGVYIDGDILCLKNLEPLLENGKAIFGYQFRNIDKNGSVCNAVMASPPNHPLFESIIYTLPSTAHKGVVNATGPDFLTNMIKSYLGTDIKIYEMPILYSHEWTEKIDRKCTENTSDCRNIYPNSYLTTIWGGSWT